MSKDQQNVPNFQGSPSIIEGITNITNAEVDKILNLEEELKKEQPSQKTTESTFKPKVPLKKSEAIGEAVVKDQIQTDDADENIRLRLLEINREIEKLKQAKNGVKLAPSSEKRVIDYSKLKESDVFDLDVPIEAIVHDLPDSTLINLRDPIYIGRWVNINPMNMGKRKAAGFTFVTKEDLSDGTLMMDLEEDENGHYRYNDVVAMKIQKERYFGALRANHLRAMAVVNRKKAQEVGKRVAQAELEKGVDPDTNLSYGRDYKKYAAENKMEVYI